MFLLLFFLQSNFILSQEFNTQLLHNFQYDVNVNDIWGYSTQYGDEYAIVGLQNGTSIVYVSRDEIYEVAFIPGETSTWRDIKVWQNHIYIGTENGSGGIQIVSMENPDSPELVSVWNEIGSSHNIMIDSGFLYIIGGDNEDLYILSLDNPENPELVGTWSGDYFHDVCIKEDLLFGCAISTNMMHIIDISNKSNPHSIGFWNDVPASHACWVDPNNDILVTASETTGGHVMNWDITNLDNIQLLSEWAPDSSETKSAHNIFIRDNFAYISYYVFGLQILDISTPSQPILTGYYDTYPGMDGLFNGAWGTYPFQQSCNIYISDRQTGLYVIEFEGCLGADPEDPIPPQNVEIYSDYLTPNSAMLNWDNPELLYNGNSLINFEIQIFQNNNYLVNLSNPINNYIVNSLEDGLNYNFELFIKDISTDSLSLGIEKGIWAGGHPIPKSPTILNYSSDQSNAIFDIQLPNIQLDSSPLDDLEKLIVLRNGSVIDSLTVQVGEILNYVDNPFPGYFYNYEFYVIDNEIPVNESDKTNSIELFIGEFPSSLILPLCSNVYDETEHFYEDLNTLEIDSYLMNLNYFYDVDLENNIENIFLFSGIFPNDCDISENVRTKLSNYLENGGNIYLEGGDIWSNISQSEFINYFNTNVISDGYNDLFQISGLDGTINELLLTEYTGENNWIDQLHGISPAYPTIINFENEYAINIFNPHENFNTISSSFEISGIENDIVRHELIQNYMSFLESGFNPTWQKGDLNHDEIINIIDIILMVEFIIEITNPILDEFWISDLNHDDFINIQDITLMVNQILAY